jgi:probable rRNA maturation factor
VRAARNDVSVVMQYAPGPAWVEVRSFRTFCGVLLRAAGLSGAEVTVLLTGDERMRELNARYRRVDRTTDVLSFGREQGGADLAPLGDIAISLPAAERNARRYRVPAGEELRRLTIHALLHLMGWDHRTAAERRRMTERQESLVALVGRGAEPTRPRRRRP